MRSRGPPTDRQQPHRGPALQEGWGLAASPRHLSEAGLPWAGRVLGLCVSQMIYLFAYLFNDYQRPVLCQVHSGCWGCNPDLQWYEVVHSPGVRVAARRQ